MYIYIYIGAAEYPALRVSGLEPERAKVVTVIATDTEVYVCIYMFIFNHKDMFIFIYI
jgi:hypothetical protein